MGGLGGTFPERYPPPTQRGGKYHYRYIVIDSLVFIASVVKRSYEEIRGTVLSEVVFGEGRGLFLVFRFFGGWSESSLNRQNGERTRRQSVRRFLVLARADPGYAARQSVMVCPRVIGKSVSRIGPGHIGPKVRSIVKHASFPVFIPCACVKPWKRVCAFFGGSDLGVNVNRQSLRLSEQAGAPMTMYTQANGISRADLEKKLRTAGLELGLKQANVDWVFLEAGSLEENLYAVPSDGLVVVGAAGESLMRELVLGSKLETIQKTLPNPLLVAARK